MLRSALAVTFFGWFALWCVAGRYVSIDFYRLNFGEAVQSGLELTAILMALALLVLPFIRPFRDQTRWSYTVLCVGFLVTVEIVWRFTVNALAWDIAKLVGFVFHLSTPALIAFGGATVVWEWRRRRDVAITTTV
jgi:hypothetical protein